MKKINSNKARIGVLTIVCSLLAIISMSFQNSFGPLVKIDALTELDTVPPVSSQGAGINIDQYEALIARMDQQIVKMQEDIAKLNIDQIQQDIKASLKLIETDKMSNQLRKATKMIDHKKIEKGINDALKEMERNHTKPAVKKSLQEAKKEFDKMDLAALKTAVEQAVTQIEKSKTAIGQLNFDELLKNAKTAILKAREDLHNGQATPAKINMLINRNDQWMHQLRDNS